MLAAKEEPIFPFFATVLVGAILAKVLSLPNVSKKHLNQTHLIATCLMILGEIYWIFVDKMSFDLWFHIHPTWFFLVNTGIQLHLILLFLRFREFNPRIDHTRWLSRSRFFRRWGRVSLTIYMLQIIEIFPRWICWKILGVDCYTRGNLNWNWTIFMIIVCMAFYELVITIWEQFHFVGTWEWFAIAIKRWTTKSAKNTPDSIDLLRYINDVIPIQFIQPKQLHIDVPTTKSSK